MRFRDSAHAYSICVLHILLYTFMLSHQEVFSAVDTSDSEPKRPKKRPAAHDDHPRKRPAAAGIFDFIRVQNVISSLAELLSFIERLMPIG